MSMRITVDDKSQEYIEECKNETNIAYKVGALFDMVEINHHRHQNSVHSLSQ